MQELLKCLASIARMGVGCGGSLVVEAMACGSVKDIRPMLRDCLVADKCLNEGSTRDVFSSFRNIHTNFNPMVLV